MKLSLTSRIVIAIFCFGIALVGFMVKLPAVFRHHDTELHTLFYFLAAGFLNVLFVKRNLVGHVLVFAGLYAMGVGIEHAQEYSNSYLGQRIHGRYDPEDVEANLKGLIYFSILWAAYVIVWYAVRGSQPQQTKAAVQDSPALPAGAQNNSNSNEPPVAGYNTAPPQDESKIREAIRFLDEVIRRDPGHPLNQELDAIVRRLNKIAGIK